MIIKIIQVPANKFVRLVFSDQEEPINRADERFLTKNAYGIDVQENQEVLPTDKTTTVDQALHLSGIEVVQVLKMQVTTDARFDAPTNHNELKDRCSC
jgi:hypothetical protein